MSLNPAGRQQIPWSGQYGLNTEVEPADLPEGLSPDNQDISFVPGKGGTRPAVQTILTTPFGNTGVTYLKSFVQPNGDPLNLELTTDGIMHQQDVQNSPNVSTSPFSVVKGTYSSSVTAFNREYFAFHDGFSAKDIPRSYDGTNWYRLTQDATATNSMTVSDAATTNFTIVNIVPKPPVNIDTITLGDGFATIVTNSPHGLSVGDHILITGNSVFQYNEQAIVATVPNPSSVTFETNATGLPVGTGGQIIPETVTVTTTAANGLISGETITISGNSDSNFNNSQGGVTTVNVGLAGGAVSLFYPNADSNGGAFPWCFGGEGPNLPGNISTTFHFPSDCTLMMDPNTDVGGTNLPGFPVYNHGESNGNGTWLPGITNGSYNGHQYLWNGTGPSNGSISASLKKDYAAVTTGSITVSAPGNVTFKVVHKEGVLIGIGGGCLPVSGPMNNPRTQTKTASKGYPLVYANNASTEFYHVSVFNSTFVVNFPAAGTYPIEIDYAQWHHSRPTFALMWQNALSDFVPLGPGAVAFATPATWTVGNVLTPTQFQFDAVYAVGTGLGGTITVGGLLSPGSHQVVVFFETATDSFTAPSAPISWNSAGAKRVVIHNAPIGPPNVIARWFAFTGAQGTNFFVIPVPARDPQTGQQVSTSTVVNDNTTTDNITFDFSDTTLFDSVAIDVTGNNLFAQTTLGPCANITSYSNRLAVWGDSNNIKNLRSMGFEGGIPFVGSTTPLWWDLSLNQGGQLVPGEFGFAWQITGNGTSSQRGLISQPAFQDYAFQAILTPSTQYTFECFAYSTIGSGAGNIKAEFYSASGGGVLATATIPVSTLGLGLANGAFMQADFNAMTPTVIPADTVLRYYTTGTVIGQQIVMDETMVVFTAQPIVPGQMRFSYAFNPEAFDGVTGVRSIEYPEPVLEAKILRDNLYIVSQGHLSRTQDSGIGEPVTWTNYTVSDKAGGLSLRSFDLGEGWGVFASNAGLYMFSGGEPVKISQEIQKLWSAIDPNLAHNVWVKNDLTNRRIYIGVPLTKYSPTGATFAPQSVNKLLVLDYRELNSSSMIENAPPLHISMTGKMLSSDLTRKWTVWNLPMNVGEIMSLPGDQEAQICFGSGLGTGIVGGMGGGGGEDQAEAYGFGNFYRLNEAKYADDDYGTIGAQNGESPLTYKQWLQSGTPTHENPVGTRPPLPATWRPMTSYYMTYLAPSHEQEQQLQVGSQRKLYEYLEVYVTGLGTFNALPFINNILNSTNRPAAPRTMDQNQIWDLEWPLNIKAQRMALLFYPSPVGVLPPNPTIDIEPETATLSTFASQQFSYLLLGTNSLAVIWSTSGGSINGSGLYTAPGTAGTYTVTVTSVEAPTVSDTAVVTVHGGYS